MKTWKTVDKSEWKNGEWMNEPDKAHWIDAKTGLDCLIVRSQTSGALCGYIGVPEKHSFFGKEHSSIDVECHGGLTFSENCREHDDPSRGICHAPENAANAKVWWLGFDCSHVFDRAPAIEFHLPEDTYRSFAYVKAEVENLARQVSV